MEALQFIRFIWFVLFLLFFGIMAVIGWILLLLERDQAKKFKKFIKTFVDQEGVDNTLKHYALFLDQRCKAEIESQRSRDRDAEVLEIQYQSAAKRVAHDKQQFWPKWQLAKDMGFSVRKSHKDYLAADDEPKSAA